MESAQFEHSLQVHFWLTHLAAEEAELVRRRRDWSLTVVPSLGQAVELLLYNVPRWIVFNKLTLKATAKGDAIIRSRHWGLHQVGEWVSNVEHSATSSGISHLLQASDGTGLTHLSTEYTVHAVVNAEMRSAHDDVSSHLEFVERDGLS